MVAAGQSAGELGKSVRGAAPHIGAENILLSSALANDPEGQRCTEQSLPCLQSSVVGERPSAECLSKRGVCGDARASASAPSFPPLSFSPPPLSIPSHQVARPVLDTLVAGRSRPVPAAWGVVMAAALQDDPVPESRCATSLPPHLTDALPSLSHPSITPHLPQNDRLRAAKTPTISPPPLSSAPMHSKSTESVRASVSPPAVCARVAERDGKLVAEPAADDSISIPVGLESESFVRACLDTGSALTLLGLDVWEWLSKRPNASKLPPLEEYSGKPIQGAGCELIPVAGEVTLSLQFGTREIEQRVLVLRDLCYPMLLGRDLLAKFGSTTVTWTGLSAGTVTLGDQTFTGTRYDSYRAALSRVAAAQAASDAKLSRKNAKRKQYWERVKRRAAALQTVGCDGSALRELEAEFGPRIEPVSEVEPPHSGGDSGSAREKVNLGGPLADGSLADDRAHSPLRRSGALASDTSSAKVEPPARVAHSSKHYVIPPRTCMRVEVKVDDGQVFPGEVGQFLPMESLSFSPLIILPGVVSTGSEGSFLVMVRNPSSRYRHLNPRSDLGTYVSLEQSDGIIVASALATPARTQEEKARECSVRDLGIDFSKMSSSLTSEQRNRVEELYGEFRECFDDGVASYPNNEQLPAHEINTGNHRPMKMRPHRMSPAEREAEREEITKLLARGAIRESKSEWGFPVLMVPKKDGTLRFCIDYRGLNAITVKDSYPLPDVKDCLATLTGMRYFSTLDAKSGFWQIPVAKADIPKTAFLSSQGLFEWLGMPMGLTNAPASFQRLMNALLAGLTWIECLVFVDDIIIFSQTFEEHLVRTRHVLERLKGRVKLNGKKTQVCQDELIYLGHSISADGVTMDPNKIKAVKEHNRPTNVKEMQSWLGLGNWFRKFIRDYARLAKPLYALTKKDTPYVWTPECEAAFLKMKELLTSPPILAWPDPTLPYRIYSDGSQQGLAATLMQVYPDGKERVVEYWSKSLSDVEFRYHTTEFELMAVVMSMRYFRPYIAGTLVTVFTDHTALKHIADQRSGGLGKPGCRAAKWTLELSQYHKTVEYVEGKRNPVDTFTRPPRPSVVEDDGTLRVGSASGGNTYVTPQRRLGGDAPQAGGCSRCGSLEHWARLCQSAQSARVASPVGESAGKFGGSPPVSLSHAKSDEERSGSPVLEPSAGREACTVEGPSSVEARVPAGNGQLLSGAQEEAAEAEFRREAASRALCALVSASVSLGPDLQPTDPHGESWRYPTSGRCAPVEKDIAPPTAHVIAAVHRVRPDRDDSSSSEESDSLNVWRKAQRADEQLKPYIEYLDYRKLPDSRPKWKHITAECDHMFLDEQGVLRRLVRVRGNPMRPESTPVTAVPACKRAEVLHGAHDDATAGHLGVLKTYVRVADAFWWPGMFEDVKQYVLSCEGCARFKAGPGGFAGVRNIPVPKQPFGILGIDHCGPFTTTRAGNSSILTMTCALTKWAEAYAVDTQTASRVAQILVEEVVCRHGPPAVLLSDRGSAFLSKVTKEACRLLKIRQSHTSAWHPQTNGLTEHFNGTLVAMLRQYVSERQNDWDVYLPYVLFAYRTSIHESTGFTPFELLYGRAPRTPLDWQVERPDYSQYRTVEDYRAVLSKGLELAHAKARHMLEQAQHKQQQRIEDQGRKVVVYKAGDKVWVKMERKSNKRKRQSAKLMSKCEGPYKVLKAVGRSKVPTTYILAHMDGRPLKGTYHVSRMRPVHPDERGVRAPPPETSGSGSESPSSSKSSAEVEQSAQGAQVQPTSAAPSQSSTESTDAAQRAPPPTPKTRKVPVRGRPEVSAQSSGGPTSRPQPFRPSSGPDSDTDKSGVDHTLLPRPVPAPSAPAPGHPTVAAPPAPAEGVSALPSSSPPLDIEEKYSDDDIPARADFTANSGLKCHIGPSHGRGLGFFVDEPVPEGTRLIEYVGVESLTPIYGPYVAEGGHKGKPIYIDADPSLGVIQARGIPAQPGGWAAYANEPRPGEWVNARLIPYKNGLYLKVVKPGGLRAGEEVLVCYGKKYQRHYDHDHTRSHCYSKQTMQALRRRESALKCRRAGPPPVVRQSPVPPSTPAGPAPRVSPPPTSAPSERVLLPLSRTGGKMWVRKRVVG